MFVWNNQRMSRWMGIKLKYKEKILTRKNLFFCKQNLFSYLHSNISSVVPKKNTLSYIFYSNIIIELYFSPKYYTYKYTNVSLNRINT